MKHQGSIKKDSDSWHVDCRFYPPDDVCRIPGRIMEMYVKGTYFTLLYYTILLYNAGRFLKEYMYSIYIYTHRNMKIYAIYCILIGLMYVFSWDNLPKYAPKISHGNGKSTIWRYISYCTRDVILVFRRVVLGQFLPFFRAITSSHRCGEALKHGRTGNSEPLPRQLWKTWPFTSDW